MSETRLYTVNPDGDVEIYETFRNAHGGAMSIWRSLVEKYFPGTQFMMLMMDGFASLFRLAKEGKMQPWETVTLMTTTDKVLIPIEHVGAVASALEEFVKGYGPQHEVNNHVFTIPAQAQALRRVIEEAEKEGWRGVCWNQMSGSDALWDGFYEKTLEDGEEFEDRRPYNIDRDEGHWIWPENKADREDAEATREAP